MAHKKRFIVKLFIALIIILIGCYFFITSSFFLCKVVAPWLDSLIGTSFTVKHAYYSPLTSYVEVEGVSVGEVGRPLVTGNGKGYFNLWAIFSNKLSFSDVHLSNVKILFDNNEKEKWNLPWLYTPSKPKTASQNSKLLQLEFKNILITDADIILQNENAKTRLELTSATLKSNLFANGKLSDVKVSGFFSLKDSTKQIISSSKLSADISVKLSYFYIPTDSNVNISLSNISSELMNYKTANNKIAVNGKIDGDGKNTLNLENILIEEFDGKEKLSNITLNSSLVINPYDFKLQINAPLISDNTLNFLAYFAYGYDFFKSSASYIGEIHSNESSFGSSGRLQIDNLYDSDNENSDNNCLVGNLKYDFLNNYKENSTSVNELVGTVKRKDKVLIMVNSLKPFKINWNDKSTVFSKTPEIVVNSNEFNPKYLNRLFNKNYLFFKDGNINSELLLFVNPSLHSLDVKGYLDADNLNSQINGFSFNNLQLKQTVNFSFYKNGLISFSNISTTINNGDPSLGTLILSGDYKTEDKKLKLDFSASDLTNNSLLFIKNIFSQQENWSNELSFFNTCKGNINGLANFDFKNKTLSLNSGEIDISDKNYGNIKGSLNKLVGFSWKDKKMRLTTDLDGKIAADDLHIDNLINALTKQQVFKSGELQFVLTFDADKELKKINLNSDFDLENLIPNISPKLKPMVLKSNLNAEIDNLEKIEIKNFSSNITSEGTDVGEIDGRGIMDFKEDRSFALSFSYDVYDKIALNFFADDETLSKIKEIDLSGRFEANKESLHAPIIYSGSAAMKKFITENETNDFSGMFKYKISQNSKLVKIEDFEVDLFNKKADILNFDANGYLRVPFDSGDSFLKIISPKADIKDTLAFLNYLKTTTDSDNSNAEYPALNFYGLNLNSSIYVKDLSYGKFLKGTLSADVNISNNEIKIEPFTINTEGTNINSIFEMNASFADGYPFHFVSECKLLSLKPLFQTILAKNYREAKATVDVCSINIAGKGFTNENIMKNLKGSFYCSLSDISLPDSVTNIAILKIILLPVESFAQLRAMLPGGFLPKNIVTSIKNAGSFFSHINNLFLNEANIYLVIRDGNIYVEQFVMLGGENAFLTSSVFSGTVGLNGDLDLKTYSNISGLKIPLNIYGTLNSPNPDLIKFISAFLTDNTIEVLNPNNWIEFAVDAGTGVKNTVKGTAEIFKQLIPDVMQNSKNSPAPNTQR